MKVLLRSIVGYREKQQYQRHRTTPERKLLIFFGVLIGILIVRLFYLQIVQGSYRRDVLVGQHYTRSSLEAERGQIFLTDKGGKQLQMTENVEYFNLFVDPKFIKDKTRVIEVLTPIVYEHFCVQYGLEEMDRRGCMENIESFTKQELLPKAEGVFVFSGAQQFYVNTDQSREETQKIIDEFSKEKGLNLIERRLENLLVGGRKEKNYLGFFDNEHLLKELTSGRYPYIEIEKDFYVYIKPNSVRSESSAAKSLQALLQRYGDFYEVDYLRALFSRQEVRYIKVLSGMNAKVAKHIKDAKTEYFSEKTERIPLLHGFGLEEYERRFYPYGEFMSHVLGYHDKNGDSYYGIEQYYDRLLGGKDGRIIGLATPWIGQVGANNFEIQDPQHGTDVFLTIDLTIQKEVEYWANYRRRALLADSVAVTVLEPSTGKVKALVNAPGYDPNNPQQYYQLEPLGFDKKYLVDSETYIDVPIFVLSGDNLRQATFDERQDSPLPKYVFSNSLGPQTFIDKNISFPYEPGSIFKAITLAIGIDTDAFGMYDFYHDSGKVKIGPYHISNVSKLCEGDHTFLHALEHSCNVGMVRMAQAMTKYVFYAYLKKHGFGNKTNIELAGEDPGTLPDFNTVSLARFFNNTYGQGILATPLQMAVSYAAVINGGHYIQPTIVEAIYDPNSNEYISLADKYQRQIYKGNTSSSMREALVSVIDNGNLQEIKKGEYSIGGKTGTSEIAFKGRYQGGAGWTNGSFVGMVTADNPKYVIAIQVRRPRTTPWGLDSAGKLFSSIADFLLAYEKIES